MDRFVAQLSRRVVNGAPASARVGTNLTFVMHGVSATSATGDRGRVCDRVCAVRLGRDRGDHGRRRGADIYIDGKDTGMQTPQRDIKLSAGKHRITLVNNEFGIKETFTVDIKADEVEKQIKDYSDRLPK
jgi:hypothetical protein